MSAYPPILAIFQSIGPWELVIIAVVALLIFGRRLPEVGRSLGKGIVEFKKGLRDTEDHLRNAGSEESDRRDPQPNDRPRGSSGEDAKG